MVREYAGMTAIRKQIAEKKTESFFIQDGHMVPVFFLPADQQKAHKFINKLAYNIFP